MKSLNKTQIILVTLLGFVCWLIPSFIYALWIKASNIGSTQAERVTIFKSYFPEFLSGRWSTTLLSIALCGLAVALNLIAISSIKSKFKVFNFVILVLSGLLMALNVWSML